PLHHEWLPRMVGQNENRHVIGRIIPPPSGPGLIPRPIAAAEHLAAHDVGADVVEEPADHIRVCRGRTALLPVLLPPARRFEEALVQPHPALTDGVLEALVRPGGKAVQRDGNLTGDGTHALMTSWSPKNNRLQ